MFQVYISISQTFNYIPNVAIPVNSVSPHLAEYFIETASMTTWNLEYRHTLQVPLPYGDTKLDTGRVSVLQFDTRSWVDYS